MGRRGITVLVAVLLVTSGCSEMVDDPTVPEDAAPPGVEPGESIRDVLDGWEDERRANAPVGLSGSLAVDGSYRVRADGGAMTAAALPAPFTLAPAPAFPSGEPVARFENATVAGANGGEGTLLVRGAAIEATDGRIRNLPVARARGDGVISLQPAADEDAPEPPSHGNETLEDLTVFGERTVVGIESVRLTNYTSAVWIDGNESRTLSGPVSVSADALWWDADSRVGTDGADLSTGRFVVVAPDAETAVRTDRRTVRGATAVFGHDATLALDPGRVDAEQVRVRQALTDEGPAFDARVEVLPERVDVAVAPGETAWVAVHYREASYAGDAVFRNATVTGAGAPYVDVPLERPPLALVRAIRELDNSSAPVPLKAAGIIALAPAAAVEVVVRGAITVVDCVVADCPSQRPYPTWIYAGEIGRFYYQVNATDASPGTYDATVRVRGENYETVEIPVRINVTTGSAESGSPRVGRPGGP